MKKEKIFIYGRHAVYEALSEKPETITDIFLDPNIKDEKLLSLLTANKIKPKNLTTKDQSLNHQGIIAKIKIDQLTIDYSLFIKNLKPDHKTALVVLNEIQDPHNVGAIIRSAAAFGLAGVLLPVHNQAPITSTVIKVSAGLAFKIPLVIIGNTNQTLTDLKKRGFWIYGLDAEGDTSISALKFAEPTVFVLGNEGAGLRLKTASACDQIISIPMAPNCESLNVSSSAAVTFYAWSQQAI